MKDLYYVLENDGYHIYDRNDPLFHVHQYEPFIPDKEKTYEENAIAQVIELSKDYGDEATEADYINALAELGVDTSEEV